MIMKKITLYCDGSSLGNPGFGGWCAILQYQNNKKMIKGNENNTTNNRMELRAVIEALKVLKEPCNVEIISDSKYVCDGIGKWLCNWRNKNFKKVKNVDLWEEYITHSREHKINTKWIKGHSGHSENEECDKIAKQEAEILKVKNDGKLDSNKLDSVDTNTKDSKENDLLNKLQKQINYFFKNKKLLIEALTHRSYNKNNNERLEFLGDAVLDLIIGEYLFKRFENSPEGDLTKLRASIVNESGFARLAKKINLGEYLFISNIEENSNGRKKISILADAFEALIGAVYLDSDLESARIISGNIINEVYKNIDLKKFSKEYKTSLQELTQSMFSNIPEYELISSKGPDHNKEFLMCVKINGQELARANGKSKKEAEQTCAKAAYKKLTGKKDVL